jgi:hypothetical protein
MNLKFGPASQASPQILAQRLLKISFDGREVSYSDIFLYFSNEEVCEKFPPSWDTHGHGRRNGGVRLDSLGVYDTHGTPMNVMPVEKMTHKKNILSSALWYVYKTVVFSSQKRIKNNGVPHFISRFCYFYFHPSCSMLSLFLFEINVDQWWWY